MTSQDLIGEYREILSDAAQSGVYRGVFRELCRRDLYFLLSVALSTSALFQRRDLNQEWLLARVLQVQAAPDGYLDLWAREHGKSTVITYGKTIQDLLNDPERTFGFFSHTRGISKGFLRQIKWELELNVELQQNFDDVLWANPARDATKWSEDDGLVLRRKGNPKEASIEAWGLVDGQPTGKHFTDLVFDDVVTDRSVGTPDQIKKTTDALALALNLGVEGGRKRYIGTRYHVHDTYRAVMDRGMAVPRIYPATADGTADGEPVLFTRESLERKRREMGPYIFGCQMLQDPVADRQQGFLAEWLKHWAVKPVAWEQMNRYILVDPAGEKTKRSDYTSMWVVGLGSDRNYYLIDGRRDRMNLTQRTRTLFQLHRQYRPLRVGYEKYGMQSDIEHIQEVMSRDVYHFDVVELGGQLPKNDRIRKLVPLFEQGRVFIPTACMFADCEGRSQNLTQLFTDEEYLDFPVGAHDDMLDCLARIVDEDLGAVFPQVVRPNQSYEQPVSERRYWR